MSDIWNDPPPVHYDDGVRFGTGWEMIAEIKRLRAAASAVREKVIEECARGAFAQQSTEGEAIAQELLGKICAMNGHKWGELVGGLLHGMRMCTDCGAVLEEPTTSGERTAPASDQRSLETNLIHPHPRQDGQQGDHPGSDGKR